MSNDRKRKEKQDPFQKSEALEIVITERMVLSFLSSLNQGDDIKMITEVSLFEFWKYIEEKRDSLPKKLFEKE